MRERKLLDLVKVTGDESSDVILSDVLPEVVKNYGTTLVSESVASIAADLVGAVCPRLNNIRLSYKQNRLERNMSIMLEHLAMNQQVLSDRINELQKTVEGKNFIQQSGEMLLDNIVDEIQSTKVQYNVNGYINLLQTENANLDMSLMFFKTISELNDIDIRILKTYDWRNMDREDPITPLNSEYDYDQIRHIKEKLLRFGLLKSKNEELSEKNQKIIIEFLEKLHKDITSNKPRGIKLPRFNKLSSTDRYSITSLGLTLLRLISEQISNDEIDE